MVSSVVTLISSTQRLSNDIFEVLKADLIPERRSLALDIYDGPLKNKILFLPSAKRCIAASFPPFLSSQTT